MSSLFGGKKSGGLFFKPAQQFGTGNSVISSEGIRIDPNVLALKNEGVGMATQSLQDLQTDRAGLSMNRSDFIQNRTKGLRESIETEGQALNKRLENTMVKGAFAEQTKENFKAMAEQKLSQGKALAIDEFNALEGNFDQLEGSAAQMLANIDMADFAQQLQARGMQQDIISKFTNLRLGQQGVSQQKKAQNQQMVGTMIMAAAMFSSLKFKREREPINNQEILNKLMEMPVEKWKYVWDNEQHIGCYAEHFNKHFGVEGSLSINIVDIIGVLMASIQAQQKQIEELKGSLDA